MAATLMLAACGGAIEAGGVSGSERHEAEQDRSEPSTPSTALCLLAGVQCGLPTGQAGGSEGTTYGASTASLSVGSDDSLMLTQANASITNEADDMFGRALAVGDFNGDGYQDLAIGAPYKNGSDLEDVGRVVVFYGTASGLDPARWEWFTQNSVTGMANEAYDRFGYALASGNFDGDAYDDLAVGIPYEDGSLSDSGAVAIMYGSSSGLLPSRTEVVRDSATSAGEQNGASFGHALTSGNFNGDGFDDLAVGSPYRTILGQAWAGHVSVLYGSGSGLLPATYEVVDQSSLSGTTVEAYDYFGYVLASGDLDDDSDDELIVGVPYEDSGVAADAGLVVVLKGAINGIVPVNATLYWQSSVASATIEPDDKFGWALAVADFNGDGISDLAASAAMEDTDFTDAGHIAILRGQSGSLPTSWSEAVTELSAHGTKETDDRAGYSLAAGDFDGDGFGDLVAGVPYEDEAGKTNNGAVLAFFGSSSGLLPARSYWFTQSYSGGTEGNSDLFGWALAAGDFDADGRSSVALGTPFEDPSGVGEAGAVYVRTIEPALPDVVGDAAIVINRTTGEVLGARFPDMLWAPASTTKMMTALLAVEAIAMGSLSLGDIVTIQSDVGIEGGGQVGLSPGDTISLRDLLYLTMLPSGNDAATAVGTYVAGSRSAFVTRMNNRAAELGLTNTSFVDISGRDPEDIIPGCSGNDFGNPSCAHYSTARDLAALARFALSRSIFATLVRTRQWTTTTWRDSAGKSKDSTHSNSNDLLFSTDADHYAGAYGVKTGTSDRAGSNLVSAATVSTEDVIAVILGSDSDGTTTGDRYDDSHVLLDFGFSRLP